LNRVAFARIARSAVSGRNLVCAGVIAAMTTVTGNAQSAGQLTVCHAGSLLAAFVQVEKAFTAQHPDVAVKDVSGGSVSLVRRLATASLPCDVYASADHLDIDQLLKPAKLADYTVVFASGRMVLAYLATDPKAPLPVSGDFNPPASIPEVAPNWYQTLLARGVRIGGAHPFLDPGGYRSHLIFELAQTYYKVPDLYNALLEHYTVIPADSTNPASAPALGREFNFQFSYEHGAATTAQSNPSYRYARLPDRIDLSTVRNSSYYAQASLTIPGLGLPGPRPSASIPGSRVAWGLTILKSSPNQKSAVSFVDLLLGPIGTAALNANGPTPISPAIVSPGDYAHLPKSTQSLVTAKEVSR
jgi:ABC-type molybdate transport system substrate-binding protein